MCAVKQQYFQHFTVKKLLVYMCVFKQENKRMPRALKYVSISLNSRLSFCFCVFNTTDRDLKIDMRVDQMFV